MTHVEHSPRRAGALWTSLVALLFSGLLYSATATAAYQQVGTFAGVPGLLKTFANQGEFPEEVQLGRLSGMAVNYTGAGGVPAGTIYAIGGNGFEAMRLARYNPDRSFGEAWGVTIKEGPYESCGPEGEAAHPHCSPLPNFGGGGERADVDVNQTTGNVYVLTPGVGISGIPRITEYSADGSEVITRFGESAASGETVPASPGKIHGAEAGGIAVNAAGEVYVSDSGPNSYRRLMVFTPKTPGDYTEYEYAGQSHDIVPEAGRFPTRPIADAAGNIYSGELTDIEKYDPTHPADPPICTFKFKKGGITSITVNPLTGEVFFFSYQDKKLHRLNPCVGGKFTEAEAIEFAPGRSAIGGLAVDPVKQFDPARAAGILYAGSPDGSGGKEKGEGSNREFESSMGFVFAPPNESSPVVVAESVSAVTSSSARLEGKLDPKGNVTRYVFQYISDAAYQANEPTERFAGALEAPAGGAQIEGSKVIPVATTVSGLLADASYHYRILATSHCSPGEPEKECVGEGAERTFSTYPLETAGLPDNRAWELVSPAQKNGGQVLPANPEASSCFAGECKPGYSYSHFPMQSTPGGDAIAYEGSPFSFDEGALIENQYIARRGASGWQSVNLTPSRLLSKGQGGYLAFKADLSQSVLEQINFPLSPLGPPDFGNLYTQPSAEPASLDPFLSEAPPNRTPGNSSERLRLYFAGASADFSRFFFGANDALTEDAQGGPEAKTNLYERSGGELHLVNLAPGNAETLPGAVFGSGELLRAGNASIPEIFTFHAISRDGSRAFWTSEEDGNLYVREDGETLEVPDPNSCATSLLPAQRVCFLTAAADGSRVLLSDGLLFDVEDLEAPPVDLTQGQGGFEGVVGQSEDLSRVYFVDTKVLTGEEENGHGAKAQEGEGKFNLYAWHEGATSFVGTLSGSGASENWHPSEDWELAPAHRSASASPDGRWLAFVSNASLTGFDSTGPCDRISGTVNFNDGPCAEVFLYEAETGELRCPSCNRTGAPPHGGAHVLQLQGASTLPPPRYLTNSGRLFFDSQDSLSPFDTNGRVEDVYEFEPNGIGDCTRAADCVRLISAGRSGIDSNFLAMDASGKNVFFTGRDQLVAADKDDLVDLYVAREGGGFPPAVGAAECQGEACLPSVSPPSDPTPASVGFKGPGNPATSQGSKRCPKGRHAVKRKGKARCVKSQAKRQHHKRHNNRGGAK